MRGGPIILHQNLTPHQKEILKSKSPYILILGPAGTAKTYTAVARGLKMFVADQIERIIIIRSAVETRPIGFLPGEAKDKMEPYSEPYVALFNQLAPKMKVRDMMHRGHVEFLPTTFLRGVTFDNAFVIVDELQNMSEHELDTIITRVGEDTHLVLCGDSTQSDLMGAEAKEHHKVVRTLSRMQEFEVYQMGLEDVVRSGFVRKYLEAKAAVG